jgi:hypothetical protein
MLADFDQNFIQMGVTHGGKTERCAALIMARSLIEESRNLTYPWNSQEAGYLLKGCDLQKI